NVTSLFPDRLGSFPTWFVAHLKRNAAIPHGAGRPRRTVLSQAALIRVAKLDWCQTGGSLVNAGNRASLGSNPAVRLLAMPTHRADSPVSERRMGFAADRHRESQLFPQSRRLAVGMSCPHAR